MQLGSVTVRERMRSRVKTLLGPKPDVFSGSGFWGRRSRVSVSAVAGLDVDEKKVITARETVVYFQVSARVNLVIPKWTDKPKQGKKPLS